MPAGPQTEPNFAQACQWWPDLQDFWTPVGWKDHLFRFNVLWNGTLIASPDRNRRTTQYKDQGVQLTPILGLGPGGSYLPTYVRRDNNMVKQGWRHRPAPVLWTQWSERGLLIEQEVFAHIPGGRAITTGDEPLFAWLRFTIADTCQAVPADETATILLKLNAVHTVFAMPAKANIRFVREASRYPRKLIAASENDVGQHGWRLLEEDGRVRLAVAPGYDNTVRFEQRLDEAELYEWRTQEKMTSQDQVLELRLKTRTRQHVDVLVPMLPAPRAVFDAELALGFNAALAQADRFWSYRPATAATVRIPEPAVQRILDQSLKFAEMIAERDPATGHYSQLTGSMVYPDLWATPGAMTLVMLLESYGYHETAAKYLELFKDEQGTVKPPGDHFQLHPGYFSTPKSLCSVDWMTDHGAILWAVASHALITGDDAFTQRWLPAIIKACEFVRYARSLKGHGGVEGVMPPAVATDDNKKIQGVWSDGWAYKGLTAAIRLLQRLGHPRAAEFAAEAADYKRAFAAALRKTSGGMPKWKDSRGRRHPLVPPTVGRVDPDMIRHGFFLDTGPMFLVFSGLMDVRDPLMRSALAWFREGPPQRMLRHNGTCWQFPALDHEVSTCEPCYSWNVYFSHAAGDRARYLEGMYSLLAADFSRQTCTMVETRGGISGLTSANPAFHLMRLAVVDDQIKPGELHLLRMFPLAWLPPGKTTRFDNMPTEFGPVSLTLKLSRDGKTLDLRYRPRFRFRGPPRKVTLHLPPVEGLRAVKVNGCQTKPAKRVLLPTRP